MQPSIDDTPFRFSCFCIPHLPTRPAGTASSLQRTACPPPSSPRLPPLPVCPPYSASSFIRRNLSEFPSRATYACYQPHATHHISHITNAKVFLAHLTSQIICVQFRCRAAAASPKPTSSGSQVSDEAARLFSCLRLVSCRVLLEPPPPCVTHGPCSAPATHCLHVFAANQAARLPFPSASEIHLSFVSCSSTDDVTQVFRRFESNTRCFDGNAHTLSSRLLQHGVYTLSPSAERFWSSTGIRPSPSHALSSCFLFVFTTLHPAPHLSLSFPPSSQPSSCRVCCG